MTSTRPWRRCSHTENVCRCNDTEAQPCVAAVIADYLNTLWWAMKTDSAFYSSRSLRIEAQGRSNLTN